MTFFELFFFCSWLVGLCVGIKIGWVHGFIGVVVGGAVGVVAGLLFYLLVLSFLSLLVWLDGKRGEKAFSIRQRRKD